MSTAEDHKGLGNKAFATKDFDEAIKCYTEAIKLDSANHVYFSNRSASYAGKKDWENAVMDAKECIRLNPSFIKGYYRLATAQYEMGDFDAASSTIKQGLNVDPDNSQLMKQMRLVKAKKAQSKLATSTKGNTAILSETQNIPGGSSLSKEVIDLQNQFRSTVRDLNIVAANISKTEKSKRMNEITKSELENLPKDSDMKMYRGIGKMFMRSKREDIFEYLDTSIKDSSKQVTELSQKKEYLQRRMKSQQQNIIELTKSSSTE
mmetsp:Transcript_21248/g.29789  ORF Transcript_21248/g.29789 Transcript_21248/m.29789 type:complete len:263 (+) Transcript_21248:204-992(+)|eukprot:CAMPEP_0184855434 /NCGR_PEP_ID=MMETSP0580-20130426/689_1 /TAXON_ID=1118495 /ORGANISM="Dactyliosolen fragilissimus" /LENGTH=262 /DNA_ID=CAMNT_0027349947 /DNA_START=133 /DNA_END=921 /DNA_ORIENTATION=+